MALEQTEVELALKRAINVGFAILDFLKKLMYDFLYYYIKQKYPDSMLLFTDADSITYQIQTDNVYDEDFYADKHLFNFSMYEKGSPSYNEENKNVIGKIKDELKEVIIEEFVGLRGKMYLLKLNKEEMRKAKGVKKNLVKKDISHQDFIYYLKKENLCIPCRLYDHLNIISTPSNRIKSPLALTMITDT